ncbi:MAG: biopolymer transporter ExbD [Candidatus Didemnitutus sp.]|nr:biopolymer transporter ExbD [Candidatus Didemnitutus sp.]
MSGLYRKRRNRPEMNLVPLIDVLVMLIFFAFVTMQFRSVATMNLTLPKVETAGKSELKDSLTITITKEGEYTFQSGARSARVTPAELERLINEVGGITKDITVLIRSDENTPLRFITEAMDICRKNGLNKIRLQSR